MLRREDLKVARLVRKRMEAIPVFKRMVVFGSRARGEASPDSDLDLFIEVSELDDEIRQQIQLVAWEESLENGVVISTFIASTDSLVNSPLAANPLLKAIELDGIVV
jgi:uncharacterized protein